MSFLKNLCGACCDFLPTCDFTRHPLIPSSANYLVKVFGNLTSGVPPYLKNRDKNEKCSL